MPSSTFPWGSLKAETLRSMARDLGLKALLPRDAMVVFLQDVSKSGLEDAQKSIASTSASSKAKPKSSSTATRKRTLSAPTALSSSSTKHHAGTSDEQDGYNTRYRGKKHPKTYARKKRLRGRRSTTSNSAHRNPNNESEGADEEDEEDEQIEGEEVERMDHDDNDIEDSQRSAAESLDSLPPRSRSQGRSPTKPTSTTPAKRPRAQSSSPVKRGRGRPRKVPSTVGEGKKRGRPRKVRPEEQDIDESPSGKPLSKSARRGSLVFDGVHIPPLKKRRTYVNATTMENGHIGPEVDMDNGEHDDDAEGSIDMEAEEYEQQMNGDNTSTSTSPIPAPSADAVEEEREPQSSPDSHHSVAPPMDEVMHEQAELITIQQQQSSTPSPSSAAVAIPAVTSSQEVDANVDVIHSDFVYSLVAALSGQMAPPSEPAQP